MESRGVPTLYERKYLKKEENMKKLKNVEKHSAGELMMEVEVHQ